MTWSSCFCDRSRLGAVMVRVGVVATASSSAWAIAVQETFEEPSATPMTGPSSTVVVPAEGSGVQPPTTSTLPGVEAMETLASLVGEWEMAGTTHRDTGEAPAGSGFAARQTARWEIPGKVLRVDWTLVDAQGAILGDGRSRITYDDFASAIVNTYTGRDRETTFSGSATLIDADRGALEWRGHETRGMAASVNFEVTYLFPDASTCVVDFIPTCVDGELGPRPSRFTWRRRNPFLSTVSFAERLIGTWSPTSGGSVESRIGFGPGRRSLVIESTAAPGGGSAAAAMLETIWFDPGSERILYRGHAADGAWMEGTVDADADREVLLVRWRGVDRHGAAASGGVRIARADAGVVREDVEWPLESSFEGGEPGAVASHADEDLP